LLLTIKQEEIKAKDPESFSVQSVGYLGDLLQSEIAASSWEYRGEAS